MRLVTIILMGIALVGGASFAEEQVCTVTCPVDAVLEGEPASYDGYIDQWNGGCNSIQWGTPFQTIDWANTQEGEAWLCGYTGWYQRPPGTEQRDTDWYIATFGPQGVIEVTLESEMPCYLKEIGPQDCEIGAPIQWHLAECGSIATMTVTGTPGSTVWLWVAPSEVPSPFGTLDFPYVMTLVGHEWTTPVSAEEMIWGGVKALYR